MCPLLYGEVFARVDLACYNLSCAPCLVDWPVLNSYMSSEVSELQCFEFLYVSFIVW